ncbi:MAG: efflux RND transporter periplasmic adaptor subunit [Candidatus Promineifilaceae bacterium]
MAEAQVRQAEVSLEEARENLANATLTAPFDGIVTELLVTQGEVAGGVVMKLVNFETLAVLVDVDEIDLGELSVGQEATITFDAYPNLELPATVDSIATVATTSTGSEIVTFEVRLSVEPVDDVDLRIGMTANANLITARREEVLLIPNEAITVDRSRGTFSVNVVEGEGEGRTVTQMQIGTGLRDGDFTQVTDGLEEGQSLLIGDFSAPTFNFGPGGDGDGGPPGPGRGG